MPGPKIVNPKVARLIGGFVGNDHPVTLRRELAGVALKYVQAARQVYLLRMIRGPIDDVWVDHSVLIDDVAAAFCRRAKAMIPDSESCPDGRLDSPPSQWQHQCGRCQRP